MASPAPPRCIAGLPRPGRAVSIRHSSGSHHGPALPCPGQTLPPSYLASMILSLFSSLLAVLVSLLAALYLALKRRHTYWRSQKVPGPAPSFPFGNFLASFSGKRRVDGDFEVAYDDFKDERYVGLFFCHTPILQIHDLDIIKHVLVKDFQDFNGRGMYCDPKRDPLSGHLFILSGGPWRSLRAKLSPSFTPGKIKTIFSQIRECATYMQDHVEAHVSAGGGSYVEDVRELMARFTTDVISSVAFGIESNSMKNPDSEIRRMGKKSLEPSLSVNLRLTLQFFARDIMKLLNISIQSPDVNAFFFKMVRETVEYREKNGVERNDLLNQLIHLKNKGFIAPEASGESAGDAAERLTMDQVTAQVFIFFLAGYDTTASTAGLTLYELAKHPEMLDKVLEEVDRVMEKHGGVTYEAVSDMPYLDKVISEVLRFYPPVPVLTRETMVDRTLPLSDVRLKKGTQVAIPAGAIQMDPRYWPNPEVFDPERFSEDNKKTIHPMSYLPFGDGPRICIGMRLGQVNVKTALLTLLSRYTVTRLPCTPDKVCMDVRAIVPCPIGGLNLKVSSRTG